MLVPRNLAWLCFTVAALLVVQQTGRCAEDDDPREMLKYLITGIQAERQKLRQGVFRIHGKEFREDPAPVGKLEGPARMLGAFDFDKGYYRFDRGSRSWKVIGKESDFLELKICRMPELSLHYNNRYKRLEIHPPNVIDPGTLVDTDGYLDIRCLGLYGRGQMFKSLELEAVCEQILAVSGLYSCVDEGNGVFRVEWISEVQRLSRWIDTNRGFTAIRKEMSYRIPELGETEWRKPHLTHEVTWTQIDGLWIPSAIQIFQQKELTPEKLPEPPDYKYTPRYRTFNHTYHIEWESINKPVDQSFFDYKEFDLPNGTQVADARSGELVILEVIGWNDNSEDVRDLTEAPPFSWTSPRVLLMLINGLLVCIAVLFWWRYNQKRAQDD